MHPANVQRPRHRLRPILPAALDNLTTAPVFILDGPQYHELRPGAEQLFRGVVLAVDGAPITSVEIVRGRELLASGPVHVPTPELAGLPASGSGACRFEFPVRLGDDPVEVRGRRSSGESVTLFHYVPPRQERARMQTVAERVLALPLPPADLVATTQGGTNVTSYANSAVSGLFALRALLVRSDCDPDAARSVLDVGCGTGRSLIGWHADDASRTLAGVDINGDLIAWDREALGGVADWRVSSVAPPLDFPAAGFDVIQLASVFTHLPLPLQRAWLGELRRLVRPGGAVVISLHGDIYVRLMLDGAAKRAFDEAGGYAEFAAAEPGANAFSTFHSREFAAKLFGELFTDLHWYPRGDDPVQPSLFPFAALQDVWVMR